MARPRSRRSSAAASNVATDRVVTRDATVHLFATLVAASGASRYSATLVLDDAARFELDVTVPGPPPDGTRAAVIRLYHPDDVPALRAVLEWAIAQYDARLAAQALASATAAA